MLKMFEEIRYNFLRKLQIWPQSLKSSTAATMVRGPKTFWEDQRAGGLKKGRKGQNFSVFAFCGCWTKNDFKDCEHGTEGSL